MQSPRILWWMVLVVLVGVLAACQEEPPEPMPTQRVMHLDPRLADGRSPARALAAERTIVGEWRLDSGADLQDDASAWSVRNGLLTPARGAEPGINVRLADFDEAKGLTMASLVYRGELNANEINAIEVEVRLPKDGAGQLKWVPRNPRESDRPADFRLEAPFVGSEEWQTITYPLDTTAAWRGRVVSMELSPAGLASASFEIRAIRFVRVGFSLGSQPIDPEGELSGDGGLMGPRGNLRRVWPSSAGVPLIAKTGILPRGAKLTVEVTVPGETTRGTVRTNVALDARPLAEGDAVSAWQAVASRTLALPELGASMMWRPFTADLGAWAGQAVEVRLRSWKGAPLASDAAPETSSQTATAGLGGALAETDVLWGVPMVIGEMHQDRRPNIVLVTLDTTRVDSVGAYGGPARTPYLDQIAASGLLFEQAWSACNSTLPSHASILTGLSVPAHGLVDNRSQLDPNVVTLAQTLRSNGYQTAAAVSVHHLQAGYSGLGRGFDQYLDVQPRATVDGTSTIEGVNKWLSDWRTAGDRPFFLWVHLFDPHTPYGPDAEWVAEYVERYQVDVPPKLLETGTIGRTNYTEAGEFLAGVNNHAYAEFLYQAGVTFADELVGRLDAELLRDGFGEHTALVVTADHGESLGEGFGDNTIWYDHRFLYDPILHVPLVMRLPGLPGRTGERVAERVSLVDLAPTLLRWVGVQPAAQNAASGDLLRATGDGDQPVYFVHSNNAQIGTKVGDETFFYNTSDYLQLGREYVTPAEMPFLFDSARDPMFRSNLAFERAERAALLQERAREWAASRVQIGGTLRAAVSSEDDAALDKLGYLSDQ